MLRGKLRQPCLLLPLPSDSALSLPCNSCGLGMAMYWKRQFAIARADEVEQTHELSPDLTPDPTP